MAKRLAYLSLIVGLGGLWPAVAAGQAVPPKLDPPGPPAPTMKTLDEIPPTWNQVLPLAQRFQLVMGGFAVLDKETGLVWQRQPWMANPSFNEPWADAARGCHALFLGNRMGWRLPTVEELTSLITGDNPQYPVGDTPLPAGHPFVGIDFGQGFWTSTTSSPGSRVVVGHELAVTQGGSNLVGTRFYIATSDIETNRHWSWCVRGGHAPDGR